MGIEVTRGGLPLGRNQRPHKTGPPQYSRHRAEKCSPEIFLTCQLVTRNLLATRENWFVLNGDICRNHVSSLPCDCNTGSFMQMNRLRFRFLVRGLSLAWALLFVALLGGCSSPEEKDREKVSRQEQMVINNEGPSATDWRARRQR